MRIDFKEVNVQNFFSFGNVPTKFIYKQGIHAISGNMIPNTTVRNGIGKTTLLAESLTFLLYGKTLKNINKDEIVNTTNENNCLVWGVFTIGQKAYKVERGIKPSTFKIWEKDIKEWQRDPDAWTEKEEIQLDSIKHTQAKLEEKIKISYTCFTNMIILNINNSIPFLGMKPEDKRSVLEDILSLSVYGRMSDKAKAKHLSAKSDITVLENDLKNAINNFNTTREKRESLLQETMKFEINKQERINEIEIEINQAEANKSKIEEKIKNVNFDEQSKLLQDDLNNTTNKINSNTNEKSKLETELSMHNDILEKLEHSDHCPVCTTTTNSPLVKTYIADIKSKVLTINESIKLLNTDNAKLKENKEVIKEKIKKLDDNIDKLKSAKSRIREIENDLKNSYENLQREKERKLEIKEIISEEEFNKIEKIVSESEDRFNTVQKDFKYNKFIRTLLGEDGVRKYVTMKVLPILNKKVNHYLSILGSDYLITFDSELKEKLIAGNRCERSYNSFSGGEKKRIDLALLLALMDVSKERNSIDTNILILDEILDTSLDTVGAELFLEHLKSAFKLTCPDKCIYIISHKKELGEETFDSIIHLVNKNGFTNIDRVIE